MKSGSITKNPKKLYLFHHDYINDNDKWHDLKKNWKIDCQKLPSTIYEERVVTWINKEQSLWCTTWD